jgi:hypothetical protein
MTRISAGLKQRGVGVWVNFVQERNKKLPAQKTGGRYKGNPYSGNTVL